jgi:hypothetical protein
MFKRLHHFVGFSGLCAGITGLVRGPGLGFLGVRAASYRLWRLWFWTRFPSVVFLEEAAPDSAGNQWLGNMV